MVLVLGAGDIMGGMGDPWAIFRLVFEGLFSAWWVIVILLVGGAALATVRGWTVWRLRTEARQERAKRKYRSDGTRWTLTAAETGHVVFSTLHTRDARGTVTRVLDMFPPDQQDEVASQMSLGLSHILSQKLIPRANGQGRVVAMEILNNTYATANLIRLRKTELIYSHLQMRTKDIPEERMTTLERSLAILVRDGQVMPLEAERWANHPSSFLDEMRALERPVGD